MSIPSQTEVASLAAHMEATGTPADQVAAFRAQFEGKQAPTAAEPGSVLAETDTASPASPQDLAMLEADTRAPSNLSAYNLPYDPSVDLDPAAREVDTTLRAWMADAGLPANIGSSIAAEAEKYLNRVASLTGQQHELEAQTTHAMLQRTFGPRTNEMLALARGLVAELDAKHGGRVSEMLEATGLGNSPALCQQLAHHAERRAALAKAKGGKHR